MGNICLKKEDTIPLSPSRSNPIKSGSIVDDSPRNTSTIAADLKESKLDSIFKAKRANVFTQGNVIMSISCNYSGSGSSSIKIICINNSTYCNSSISIYINTTSYYHHTTATATIITTTTTSTTTNTTSTSTTSNNNYYYL